ncbi:MAG TPA: NTP transferase domain-containing protein, partial [Nitrolancea sp.]|nr:NTP transferase domain-containing protein [Nitrolancea sp.]
MPCGAVLVAAGRSARMGFDKILTMLDDRPVLAYSLELLAAMDAISEIVVVTSPDKLDRVQRLAGRRAHVRVCPGGET